MNAAERAVVRECARLCRLGESCIPGDDPVDPFRRGLPTSHRGTGLTVWIREALERNIHLPRQLEDRLRDFVCSAEGNCR